MHCLYHQKNPSTQHITIIAMVQLMTQYPFHFFQISILGIHIYGLAEQSHTNGTGQTSMAVNLRLSNQNGHFFMELLITLQQCGIGNLFPTFVEIPLHPPILHQMKQQEQRHTHCPNLIQFRKCLFLRLCCWHRCFCCLLLALCLHDKTFLPLGKIFS